MPRQKKKETKTVDTKAPQAGGVDKKEKKEKKAAPAKVVEKVAKAAGKKVEEVKKVTKSVPAKKQEKSKGKKKDVVMEESSDEEFSAHSSSSSSSSSSSASSSASASASGSSSSGSSSSGSDSEAAPVAAAPAVEGDGKIFIGNLAFSIAEGDVRSFFQGTITDIAWNERNGRFDGSGIVTFSTEAEAQTALQKNGIQLLGRPTRIVKNYSQGEAFAGEPSTSVFINNLSFDATEDDLRSIYSECGEIVGIRFPQKQGMAFVEYSNVDEAKAAIAKSFNLDIKGRAVRAEYAKTSRAASAPAAGARPANQFGAFKTPKPAGGNTFFIGGLPDACEEKDLQAAFPGCGIANVRWVERDGVFKGVGFVEFADTNEADKAFIIANKGIKISGRSLRFDWAEGKRK